MVILTKRVKFKMQHIYKLCQDYVYHDPEKHKARNLSLPLANVYILNLCNNYYARKL